MNPQSRVALLTSGRLGLLPFVPYSRKVLIHKGTRTKPAAKPSLAGEHILRKRQADGLDRKDLAGRLGVSDFTLMNWELGRTVIIPVRVMPGICKYLGYNPEPKPNGVGPQLRWKRRALGWTTREAAGRNSVDQSTWETWEKQASWPPYPRYKALLEGFLELPLEQLTSGVRSAAPARAR